MRALRNHATGLLALAVALGMVAALLGVRVATVMGCNASLINPCSRSAYVAKFVNRCVVNPPGGGPVTVPIGLVPFVTWNTAGACGQPSSHTLRVTLTCTEFPGGGTPIVVGPLTVPMAASFPTVPGNQAISGGSPFPFVVPGGTLTPGKQYTCLVEAEYDVDFFGGAGSLGRGSIRGVGDTEVCIVEPSPADPTKPRLFTARVEAGFTYAQRGDQAIEHFVVANNDPQNYCIVTFGAFSNQVAGTPQVLGGPNENVHSVSQPGVGDDFLLSYVELLDPFELIDVSRIDASVDTTIEKPMILLPGEVQIVSFASRSNGMCLDGSCSDLINRVVGEFADGSPALGGAGSTHQVDRNAPPLTNLCTITDTISASDRVEVRWGPATFDGQLDRRTHAAGNLDLGEFGRATQLDGPFASNAFGRNGLGFTATSTSVIRGDPPQFADFNVGAFVINPQGTGSNAQENIVHLDFPFLGTPGSPPSRFEIPLIRRALEDSDFQISTDGQDVRVFQGKKTIYNGPISGLTSAGLSVDPGTARVVEVDCPDGTVQQEVVPSSAALSFSIPRGPDPSPLEFFAATKDRFSSSQPATITVRGTDALVLDTIDPVYDGGPVGFVVLTNSIPIAPEDPEIGLIDWSTVDVVPATFTTPVALRQTFTSTLPIQDVSDLSTKITVQYKKPEKARDKAVIKFRLPVAEGFDPTGKVFAFEIGSAVRTVTLDARGRGTSGDFSVRVKAKKRGGVVSAQDAKVTITLKKTDLSGVIAQEGLLDGTEETVTGIRLRALFCDMVFERDALVTINANEGKKTTLSSRD